MAVAGVPAAAVFSDVNLAGVEEVYIGFGNRGNLQPGARADFNGDCVVSREDLEIMAEEWPDSSEAILGRYEDHVIDFKDYAILAGSWLEERLWPSE